jgi:DNA processing protein
MWRAELADFKMTGWDEQLVHEFLLWRDGVDEDKIAATLQREGITAITQHDASYPDLLKQIYDPPFCIFVRGALPQTEFPLAVVGTRKFTSYGKQVTEELVGELAAQGIAIVSGLALGIDGIAHAATLRVGGKTIAVLGGGVDRNYIYPRAHLTLAHHIIEHGGAVISEYPPGTLPTNYTFPRRNRIIAGMSLGTLVVEAGEASGALITAQCSLDAGREVFAIPQNITSPTAVGPNNLLKMGAKPVTSAQDILDALNLRDIRQYVSNTAILPDTPTEAEVLKILSRTPVHIDQLIKETRLEGSKVMSTMTLMEMKGKVRNLGGMMYVVAR